MASTERVLDLLKILAENREGVSFSEIRERGYTAPTLSRLLKDFLAAGMVEKTEEGCYRTGDGARKMARAILNASSPGELMAVQVRELALRTGESAAYYEPADEGIRLIVKWEISQSFHYIREGDLNLQEDHGFRKVLEDDSHRNGTFHETCQTAPGFERLSSPVYPEGEGKPSGSLGITFSRGKYGGERLEFLRAAVRRAAQDSSVILSKKS